MFLWKQCYIVYTEKFIVYLLCATPYRDKRKMTNTSSKTLKQWVSVIEVNVECFGDTDNGYINHSRGQEGLSLEGHA